MKKFICLLLALILLLGLCACGKKEKAVRQETTETVAEKSVSALQYFDGNTLVRFTYAENVWKWADSLDFPLDDTFVLEMVAEVKTLLQAESIGKTDDAATYGVGESQKYVSITDAEKTVTLSFGKQNSEGKWYFSRDDQEGLLYLAEEDFVQKLSTPIYELAILPALPAFSSENICAVTLEQSDSLHLHLVLKEKAWYNGGKVFAAEGLEEALSGLTVAKCVDYLPSSGAISLCGLDAPLTVTVSYTNSVSSQSDWQLHIGNISVEGDGYYVSFNGDTTVYLIPKENLATILELADCNREEAPTEATELTLE